MISYEEQIEQVIQATAIQLPCTVTWFGQPSRPPLVRLREGISAGVLRQHQLTALQQRLYRDFYLSGGAVARRRERTALVVPDAHTFIGSLQAANSGSGTWSTGWSELARTETSVIVRDVQLDLALWLEPSDVRLLGGQAVGIRLPSAMPAWSPGFWLALGDAPFAHRDEQQVRFYWNVRPDGAALLVEHATQLLNDATIPFRLKLLADPSRYTRCDAGVLYLPESAVEQAEPIVQQIYDRVQAALKPAVPALTLRLAPGLATADDPAGDESFGSYCCRLLADAMIAAAEAGINRLPERVDAVIAHLTAQGMDIEQPYRRQAMANTRSLTVSIEPPRAVTSPSAERVQSDDLIDVATTIADHIVGDAIWHDGACVWLGMTEQYERGAPVYGTLGPDLYGGSAGIALFLGDAYAMTRNTTYRDTALGGIRHALTHAHGVAPPSILGLYTGLPGLAIAAARLASSLDEPALLDDACSLVQDIELVASREHDLLSGTAGALLAVLTLHSVTNDEHWIECAIRLGDRLLDAARRGSIGYTWRSGQRALTGLSHGASGISVALLELAVATGEDRFAVAAHGAFGWERRLFNSAAGNWPDLRRVSGPARRSTPLPFGTSWCHGAPGIALARLRAADLLADDTLREEARVALETTRLWVEDALARGDESFCLCHGLAGNAMALIDGGAALNIPAFTDAAHAVASTGIERYADDPNHWPSGTYAGPTPGLMLGLAGIGHFYLRLANPTVPSILLPAPVRSPTNPCH